MVRDAFATAALRGLGRNLISDANFHDWPLGSGQSWSRSRPGQKVGAASPCWPSATTMSFGGTRVLWGGAALWDHIMTCRKSPAADLLELPSVLWSPGWVMQRLDPVRCAGVAGGEADRRVLVREVLNEWLQ